MVSHDAVFLIARSHVVRVYIADTRRTTHEPLDEQPPVYRNSSNCNPRNLSLIDWLIGNGVALPLCCGLTVAASVRWC